MTDVPDSNASAAGQAGSPSQEAGSNQPVTILHPTIASERLLRVQIPHNEAGRKFVRDLQDLLQTKELPFYNICGKVQARADDGKPSAESDQPATSTLSLQMDQVGWPPG